MDDTTYNVQVWCGDCLGDPYGCFEGRSEYIWDDDDNPREFATKEEAEQAAYDFINDCGPWRYDVIEVERG